MAQTEKVLFLPYNGLTFGISPQGRIAVRLDFPREEIGLVPEVHLAIELTPAEARAVAGMLQRKAIEAENAALPKP